MHGQKDENTFTETYYALEIAVELDGKMDMQGDVSPQFIDANHLVLISWLCLLISQQRL